MRVSSKRLHKVNVSDVIEFSIPWHQLSISWHKTGIRPNSIEINSKLLNYNIQANRILELNHIEILDLYLINHKAHYNHSVFYIIDIKLYWLLISGQSWLNTSQYKTTSIILVAHNVTTQKCIWYDTTCCPRILSRTNVSLYEWSVKGLNYFEKNIKHVRKYRPKLIKYLQRFTLLTGW